MMTVVELVEALDDFDNHLEVAIETEERGMAVYRHVAEVDYRSGRVVLTVGDKAEVEDA